MNIGSLAQKGDDLLDFAKGDDVAQLFLAGIEPHAFAAVFGDVRAEEFFRLEAGGKKVHIVHKRVRDVRIGEGRWKLRFPNALGKPGPGGPLSKMFLQVAGQAGDLLALVFGRYGNEDRLVKSAANEFDLSALDQFFQGVKIFRAMLLKPGQERPGIMKTHMNAGMIFELLKERKVGILVRFLKNVFKIAARLVGMNEESKMEGLRHGYGFFFLLFFIPTMIASRAIL